MDAVSAQVGHSLGRDLSQGSSRRWFPENWYETQIRSTTVTQTGPQDGSLVQDCDNRNMSEQQI